MTPGRGASARARWRCSARSTATRCGSSRSATGPASSAAAPTPQRSGQLGVVKLLGESSIGVRRTPGRGAGRRRRLPVPGPRARARRPAHRGAQGAPRGAARAGRRHRRAAARARRRRSSRSRVAAAARRRAGSLAASAEDVHGVAFVGHEAPGAGGGDAAHPGPRRAQQAALRPGRGDRDRRLGAGQAVGRGGGQRRRPRGRRLGQRRSCARPRRCSAARAAARTTSRRAAAPTRRGPTRRWRRSGRPSPRTGPARRPQMDDELRGVRLGIDPGDVRIGVASSDPTGILATPVETVARGEGDLARIGGPRGGARRGRGSTSACRARCPGRGPRGR